MPMIILGSIVIPATRRMAFVKSYSDRLSQVP
jgi:hypothetical protein